MKEGSFPSPSWHTPKGQAGGLRETYTPSSCFHFSLRAEDSGETQGGSKSCRDADVCYQPY